jgi:hypothetical protein
MFDQRTRLINAGEISVIGLSKLEAVTKFFNRLLKTNIIQIHSQPK